MVARRVRGALKPDGFNPVREPYGITLLPSRPKFIPKVSKEKQSPSMRKGMQYERMIKSIFSQAFHESYCHGQWIEFWERGVKRWCQVDGIWVNRERKILTIFEIKYRHTVKAWWQLRRLYSPILWRYLQELGEKEFKIAICEVVKVFDPSVEFPEKVALISKVEEIQPGRFQVIQINGREGYWEKGPSPSNCSNPRARPFPAISHCPILGMEEA